MTILLILLADVKILNEFYYIKYLTCGGLRSCLKCMTILKDEQNEEDGDWLNLSRLKGNIHFFWAAVSHSWNLNKNWVYPYLLFLKEDSRVDYDVTFINMDKYNFFVCGGWGDSFISFLIHTYTSVRVFF